MTSAQDTFEIPESLVCEKTGLTRDDLRQRRPTFAQYTKKTARGFFWSQDGLYALAASIAAQAGAEAAPEPVSVPKPEVMVVVRRRNARVLHVVRPGENYDPRAPLHVWLPRPISQLFIPRMKVLVTPREGRDDLFDLAGNPDNPARRWPRRIGQW